MRFSVPKFIEYETKLVGPLTFKQSLYIGIPASICFLLYFTLAPKNFVLFVFLCIILMGTGLSLAFIRIGGRSLPILFVNFFKFTMAPKTYFWTKRERPIFTLEIEKKEIKKEKEEPLPKIGEGGRLERLRTQIETKTR